MKIVVTGASGYLGSVLVGKLLKEGHNVIAIDNLIYGQTSLLGYINIPNFSFYKIDVSVFEPTELYTQADVIIPLAGIVGAPACKRSPNSLLINDTVVCSLAKYKAKIIYPNTNSGYGTKSGTKHCTEKTALEPISEYGIQKVHAEKYLLENHEQTVSLRLATVFGVSGRMRWDLLVNGLVYDALKTKTVVLYEPHAVRNYIHIKDVCDCFIFCIDNWNKMKGEVYNLGLEKANLSKLELAQLVAAQTNCEIFTSPKQIDEDKRNYIVSNAKLKEAGFTAMYGLEDGIQDLIQAYEMMPKEVWRNV